MSNTFSGVSARIAIVVVGCELVNLSGIDLEASGSTNLAVDAQDDLAVTTDINWVGSTAARALSLASGSASFMELAE